MPDVNEIYQSEFLRAAQLGGQTRRVTIESAVVEVLGQGEKAQQKIVLRYKGVKPRHPLNKTNATTLAAAWGPKSDNWVGRQVDLRPEKVLFGTAGLVDSIRVQAVPEAPKGPPSPPAVPSAAPTLAPPPPAGPIADAAEPDGWPEELADDIPWTAR